MRKGFTVLEALLTLLLLALVLQGGWTLLVRHREAAFWTARRAEGLETVRTVSWVLSEEISHGRGGVDWWVTSGDSLALRAFRGLGTVLPGSYQEDRIRLCYRGLRSPNPAKDSVLILGRHGLWLPVGLVGRARIAAPCGDMENGWGEEWVLSLPVPGAVLGRIFERGSYHLADSALRYRRGSSGRQPLTPVRIEEGVLGLSPRPEGGIIWEILLTEPEAKPEALLWKGGAR